MMKPEVITTTGHPRGLSTLFFTEMWERFSFYGMRAIFAPFMVATTSAGGLGFSKSTSGALLAVYMASVYMLSLPGGWIADKYLGQKRAIVSGGLIIMLGHILLAVPAMATFYAGLACIVIGTGFLKPNVSSLVGKLYAPGDARRDGGFSIFYMGINVGAFVAPIICGWLAQSDAFKAILVDMGADPAHVAHTAWHIAFGAAAVGMGVGLLQFYLGRAHLAGVGNPPRITDPVERATNFKILKGIIAAMVLFPAALTAVHYAVHPLNQEIISWIFGVILWAVFAGTFAVLFERAKTQRERKGITAMIALAIGCAVFFALFEQAAGTMNSFADEKTHNVAFGSPFPSSWFQSVNAVFIVLLSPVFAAFFTWIVARKVKFNDIKKFSVALVLMAMAFVVLLPAVWQVGRVSPMYLVMFYLFSTLAELFLSPVGLSSMSKLAPPAASGLVMGVWFLSTSNGDFIAGKMHGLADSVSQSTLFIITIISALAVAVALFFVGKYFTDKVPLEELQYSAEDDTTGAAHLPDSQATVTGTGIAGFATAAALWPVALTSPSLGVAISLILGPAAILMALKGLKETVGGAVGGRIFALLAFPLTIGAAGYAVYGVTTAPTDAPTQAIVEPEAVEAAQAAPTPAPTTPVAAEAPAAAAPAPAAP